MVLKRGLQCSRHSPLLWPLYLHLYCQQSGTRRPSAPRPLALRHVPAASLPRLASAARQQP